LPHGIGILRQGERTGHPLPLREGVETSTPNGRLVFGIFASIAEFEQELIRSRVRSGLAAARARGKRLGRPRLNVDARKAAALREEGATICRETGLTRGTAQRALLRLPKNPCGAMSVAD
jgi:DNA invertase Pin-like site-specific DNA recombinase